MSADYQQWWLAVLGRTVVWARLNVQASGVAEVFDCDGRTLPYDSEDSARAALLDAEFRALDGLDDDDAQTLGFRLADVPPPQGDNEAELREHMIQPLLGES